ncbi:MAG TPA: hypothetical protein VHE80_00860, partial [Acidimicrobiales bacterium]|nr:hypothetical protein [Acidimicrobiales bacterium]
MTVADLYADVVGQERAVAQLRSAARSPVHAYLLVGPAGSGTREAASSFAADLLCRHGGCGRCEVCRRALAGIHPDVAFHERSGPYITVADARSIARAAGTSPVEGRRKVLVLVDFHLVHDAAPALLKTIEEPPATTVFVVLAEHVPPELVTIASRCVLVELQPVPAERIAEALAADGVPASTAAEIAAAAGGNVERARLLASDPGFADRQALWRSVPGRLDGTGATVSVLAEELLGSLGGVLEPLRRNQEAELAEVEERARLYGEAGPSKRHLEERHKREQRRLRLDELRAGLVTVAGAYRDRLASGADPKPCLDALDVIAAAHEALGRNPNETLLLQAMLVRLD